VTVRDFQTKANDQLLAVYEDGELRSVWKWWMCERLKCNPVELRMVLDGILSETHQEQLEMDLNRLLRGEPLQYILGSTEFCSLRIKCSPHALIPRPETEELVHWILEENDANLCRFLDIGTGTGCIPLAIKNQRPSWSVSALDCSEKSLELARENALIHSLDCHWINYDLLSDGHFPLVGPLHIIASNPPYIPWNEKEQMASRVKDFEPNIALFVPDEDPLIFYRKIIEFSLRYGASNVKVYFEIHELLSQELVELLKRKHFANIEIRKDLQGKERMIRAQRLSLSCET
jgi:release factor glutamine methyltransferase